MVGFGLLTWAYTKIKLPIPKVCEEVKDSYMTLSRIKLSDGRHLAYKELGVPKDKAKYKVIVVHGFDSSKDIYLPLSKQFMENIGIYIVTFDRAGYGESDPNPNRSIKSETFDVEELADKLELGSKFYIVGISIGNYISWGFLKYIPHRLAGIALVVPVINYWWPSFPAKLSNEACKMLLKKDQLTLWIAHNFPEFLHWWMTQKWFPPSTVEKNPVIFNDKDLEAINKMMQIPNPNECKIRQQGEYESLHRDVKIGFGKWEFDPMELQNPFTQNNGFVHLWQGYEDRLVPYQLQRFIAKKLPWIKYHEVPNGGHLIIHDEIICEKIIKCLVLGEEDTSFK